MKRKSGRLYRDKRGVTLIDLILVMVIVAIAIPPILGLLIQVVRGNTFGVTVSHSNSLASTLLDEIRSKQWDQTDPTPSVTLGPDAETRTTYNDVDDFDGLDESPPQDSLGNPLAGFNGYRQQVSVCYVTNTDLNTCVGGPTIYKKVTVTVTDPEGRATERVTLFSSY